MKASTTTGRAVSGKTTKACEVDLLNRLYRIEPEVKWSRYEKLDAHEEPNLLGLVERSLIVLYPERGEPVEVVIDGPLPDELRSGSVTA